MRRFLYKQYIQLKSYLKGNRIRPSKVFALLEKSQYWDSPSMESFQLRHINELLKEALDNVEYYKNAQDYSSDTFQSLDEFKNQFPRITKSLIIKNLETLVNKKKINHSTHCTSGSTGVPLCTKISEKAEAYRTASRIRFYKWWGMDFYDRHVLIWRIVDVPGGPVKKWIKKMEAKFKGRLVINVFGLSEKTIEKDYKTLVDYRPEYVRGYKSGVLQFARLLHKKGIVFESNTLKLVVVTSELLLEEERAFMEKVFGVPVANEYGAADGGQIAFECPEGSMHISQESVYLGTDESGLVLLTEFHNNKMPMINYEIGDTVELSDKGCKCGRTLAVIDKINGRITDYMDCPDGSKMNSLILPRIFNDLEERFPGSIEQFRVIQTGMKLKVEIAAGPNFKDELKNEVRSYIDQKVCTGFEVEFALVSEIQREKSGKLRHYFKKEATN